ncbi:putative membrane protein YczE [Streptococcus saliviloxodontae]|uniref:Membrane protein YczE n=1 Tax=Streptococcus saliviloxodontae TaxID=1349416 RepID=A0ABS2PK51_9STRE|nr:putative membrane protein YczE [Streptococcus saliviloxodontae]
MSIYMMLPLILLLLLYILFLIIDILSHKNTRYFPWWVWIIVSCVSLPFGGIIYLLIGREK